MAVQAAHAPDDPATKSASGRAGDRADERRAAPFRSLLNPEASQAPAGADVGQPGYFHDVYLGHLEDALTAGRDEYDLTPFFRTRAVGVAGVRYRQDVFRDLEMAPVRDLLVAFADQMTGMRKMTAAAAKLHHELPRRRWFLNAVDQYWHAVTRLADGLGTVEVCSDGLSGLRDYLARYVDDQRFTALRSESSGLLNELAAVRYDLLIRGTKLTVGPFDDEADYSEQVLATFERFRQGDVKDHHAKISPVGGMNHVEVAILELVARLYPDLFARLGEFCARYETFVDATLARADRELQFYLAYLDCIAPLRRAGLELSLPEVSSTSKAISATATFDLALAAKLIREGAPVVTNDFHLDGAERILVVSGPNNGGMTTLARTFGQLCHLAALGCPVPGSDVHVFLPDEIYTHFEREEDIATLAGKLEDELNRIRAILDTATADSVIVLNEIFNSTTVADAAELSRRILTRISDLDALCLCVTFIDELSTLDDKTVSMVSTVDPDDPAIRTYRLVRKPADGRAYALAIAKKYHLTYNMLTGRIA